MKRTTSIQLVLISSSLILAGCGRAPQNAAQQRCLDANGQPKKNEQGQPVNCQGLPITSGTRSHYYGHPWFGYGYGRGYGGSWGSSHNATAPATHAPAGATGTHTSTGIHPSGTHSTTTTHTGSVSHAGGFGHSSHSVSS
jgi:hypothetical protein